VSSRLEVVAGPIFSGKTEELIRRIKRELIARRNVLVIKPFVDFRTADFIASRAIDAEGKPFIVERYPASIIHDNADLRRALLASYDMLAVSEAQFFGPEFPLAIEALLHERMHDDLIVVAEGLDLDYRKLPFGAMPALLAMADDVRKLDAICMKCHCKGARFTQRIRGTSATVQVGDAGDYEVRCRTCHYVFSE
jgi:thymidine kinase